MADNNVPVTPPGFVNVWQNGENPPRGKDCQSWPWGVGGYFSSGYDFPGTDYEYNGNLRWLICYYKKLVPQIELMMRAITELQGLYDGIPGLVAKYVAEAVAPVYKQLQDVKDAMLELQDKVDAQLQEQMRLILQTQAMLTQLELGVQKMQISLKQYADVGDQNTYNRVMKYLETWNKKWPPVKCPVDGAYEDIQTVVWHLYNALRRGVTYRNFNNYQFKYVQFDNFHVTYHEFDTVGRDVFADKLDARFYMFSPFDGVWTFWRDLIWDLYRLHFPGTTYEQLDTLAETYEAFDVRALTYTDFNGTWTVPAA